MALKNPVWFITGCSTGFGRDLAKLTIARGWPTVVTARDVTRVEDLSGEHVLALPLDVTDAAQIIAAVQAAEARFGRVDVLVNNAGYGYQASVEEGDDAEIRAMFEANVFGLFAMTRAVLPGMRARRSGHILNVSSIGGLIGFASSGYYSASKHAVEGLSDALSREVGPLGIRVTCIEPGPFRTDWAGRSLRQTQTKIADYTDTVGARLASTSGYSGNQPGDPVRAGEAMIHVTEVDHPPLHFVLGAFGVDAVEKKLQATMADLTAWREAGIATDFPQQHQ